MGKELARTDDSAKLLQLAIDKDLDVDKLEKLIDMRNADLALRARQAFHAAMTSFHERCPTIARNRTAKVATRGGTGYGYQYADLDSIQRVIDPLLSSLDLRYSFNTSASDGMLSVTCKLSHVEGHDTEALFACPTASQGGMSDAQRYGAALTYAKRQSLCSVLGLRMGDADTDGADPQDAKPITAEQAEDIRKAIVDMQRSESQFASLYGVETLEQIPASRMDDVNRKLDEAAKRLGMKK